MIPIFDLDDTLYPEITYVRSGLLAVANELNIRYGWSKSEIFNNMLSTLSNEGRGLVFNRLLASKNALSAKRVKECVDIYRHHKPVIELAPLVQDTLKKIRTRPYLVTDGHKIVQQNKIIALNISHFFKKMYITHRYGIRYSKPSIHCFELIKKLEGCEWGDMFYVGDNPSKDFVNLNMLGVKTIRILTGEHSKVKAKIGYDAKLKINSLDELEIITQEIF